MATQLTQLTNNELLNNFESETWRNLTYQHKRNVFQELENRCAKEQGREPANIEVKLCNDRYGSYNLATNTIRINVLNNFADNSSYEQLDSYFHESRHAQQLQAINTGKGFDNNTLNMYKVELARDANGNLYNYFSETYMNDVQICEMDSNNFALRNMLSHEEIFKRDEEYYNYLNLRQKHFEKVNNWRLTYADHIEDQRLKIIDKSGKRKDVSINEKKELKHFIKNSNTFIAEKESLFIQSELKAKNFVHDTLADNLSSDSTSKQKHREVNKVVSRTKDGDFADDKITKENTNYSAVSYGSGIVKSNAVTKDGRITMNNIFKGSATESEISAFVGKDVITAYAKNIDNPTEIGYPYWDSVTHPETGERLQAVKGYCNPNNTNECYYAEYRDSNGGAWHYVDTSYVRNNPLLDSKTIQDQINEDAAIYKQRHPIDNADGGLENVQGQSLFNDSEATQRRGPTETQCRNFFDNDVSGGDAGVSGESKGESEAESKINNIYNGLK